MNQAFRKLDAERQKAILRAAYQEFAEKGYEKASTNQMVKTAQIGKGMLFYYFGSKEALYLYLIEEGILWMRDNYLARLPTEETDYVEKIVKAGQVKQAVYSAHPEMLGFMGKVYLENAEVVPMPLREAMEDARREGQEKLHQNVDGGRFREDLPPERVMELIRWSIEGYERMLIERFKEAPQVDMNLEVYWQEFYIFLDQIKQIYYKKGGTEA